MTATLMVKERIEDGVDAGTRRLFFAYSANMDKRRMQARCPSVLFLGPARLPGHRLDFTRYSPRWNGGVADVIVDPAHSVWGLLYSIEDADLAALDTLEQYPDGYTRKKVTVWLEVPEASPPAPTVVPNVPPGGDVFSLQPDPPVGGNFVPVDSAWVYQVAHKRPYVPAADDYLRELLLAAVWFRFPKSYRDHLMSFVGRTVESDSFHSQLRELTRDLWDTDPPAADR